MYYFLCPRKNASIIDFIGNSTQPINLYGPKTGFPIMSNSGPCKPDLHYIDPLLRFDLKEIEALIADERYFVLHAPRQTGKTTSLLALMEYLNQQGT